ncbi:hypothetical protein [Ruminococcus sp.]|uniref:hypothetical protein n=1 Tax=Ruminococcus sp. TaxID=41978 RepID=UPI0025E52E61|nr:hypothetical protein [Ruminococcus sp.]
MFAQSTLLTVGRALNHQGTKPKCTANYKSETNFPTIGAGTLPTQSQLSISEREQSHIPRTN